MVKDGKRGNPLLPHGLLFPISKGSFICIIADRWMDEWISTDNNGWI